MVTLLHSPFTCSFVFTARELATGPPYCSSKGFQPLSLCHPGQWLTVIRVPYRYSTQWVTCPNDWIGFENCIGKFPWHKVICYYLRCP